MEQAQGLQARSDSDKNILERAQSGGVTAGDAKEEDAKATRQKSAERRESGEFIGGSHALRARYGGDVRKVCSIFYTYIDIYIYERDLL